MSNIVSATESPVQIKIPETEQDVPAKEQVGKYGPGVYFEDEAPRYWEDPSRYKDYDKESRERFEALGSDDATFIVGEAEVLGGAVSRAFMHGGNIAVNTFKEYRRKVDNGPQDPAWDNTAKNEFIKQNLNTIGTEQAWRFWGTKNAGEANELMADMVADQNAMKVQSHLGITGQLAAGFIAGMVDVDTPLTLLSGGLGTAAKAGIMATSVGRLAAGFASGAAMGAALGSLDYQVNPNAQAEDIALFTVMGGAFGILGTPKRGVHPVDMTDGIAKGVQEEIGENLNFNYRRDIDRTESVDYWATDDLDFDTALRDELGASPSAVPGEKVEMDLDAADAAAGPTSREPGAFLPPEQGPSSAGAAQVRGAGIRRDGNKRYESPKHEQMVRNAEARDKQLGISAEWEDPTVNMQNRFSEGAGRAARRFAQIAQKIGVGTDHGRLMNSNSSIFKMLSFDILESPSGIARNSNSAAILKESYRTEMAGVFQPYYDAMKNWKAENGHTWKDDFWPISNGPSKQEQFDREVVTELMARAYGGKGSSNKWVKQAADAHDAMYKLDVEIGQGRGNEIGMESYQGFQARAGYVQQRWSGKKMQDMINTAERHVPGSGDKMRSQFVKAIDNEYKTQYPTLKPDERKAIANAVVSRALTNNKAISRNLLTLLNGDEAPFVRQRLRDSGLKDDTIDRIMNGLMGARDEKGKPAHTKARYDVDFRTRTPYGFDMMDLLDTNLHEMAHRRMSQTSGLAALARKGIISRAKFEEIKAAGLAEQAAKGRKVFEQDRDLDIKAIDALENDAPVTPEFIDDIYSYFNGTPVAGGISPVYARIKKVTSLALMNQLGLTQFAEFGAVAAGVGLEHFMAHAGTMFRKASSDKASPLMQEMHHFNIFVPEENAFRPDLAFEYEKAANDGVLMEKLDRMLNKGTRVQGYISGFYAVREAQQKMVLSAGTARLFESINKGGKGQWTDMRLADMGIDLDKYEKLVANKVVEFDSEGRLVKMNFDKWDYETQQNFRTSMHRLTGQLIQKAMAGESNVMFHKDGMAQLFFQFKSFPLLSMEKQFHRNMRMADSAAIQLFMLGTITAGMAYTGRQLINGRTDRLDAASIARGAINYSNMAGWIGMWADPIAGLLGMDPIVSGYNPQGAGGIIPVPAAFGVLDKMAAAPSALVNLLGTPLGVTQYDNNDLRALSTIPLAGNAIGVSFLLNALRHESKRKTQVQEEQEGPLGGAVDSAGIVSSALGMN